MGEKAKSTCVYIVTNDYLCRPDDGTERYPLYKIGIAADVKKRFHGTKEGNCRVTDCPGDIIIKNVVDFGSESIARDIEKKIHKILSVCRVTGARNKKWEWFELSDEQVVGLCDLLNAMGKKVTDVEAFAESIGGRVEMEDEVVSVAKKRKKYSLAEIGLVPGDKLMPKNPQYKDVVTVYDDKQVLYKGEPMSTSRAALKISGKIDSGFRFFKALKTAKNGQKAKTLNDMVLEQYGSPEDMENMGD